MELLNPLARCSGTTHLSFNLSIEFGQVGFDSGEFSCFLCQPLLQFGERGGVTNTQAFYCIRFGWLFIQRCPQCVRLGGSGVECRGVLFCRNIGVEFNLQLRISVSQQPQHRGPRLVVQALSTFNSLYCFLNLCGRVIGGNRHSGDHDLLRRHRG